MYSEFHIISIHNYKISPSVNKHSQPSKRKEITTNSQPSKRKEITTKKMKMSAAGPNKDKKTNKR